jgi:structural maintenance of chromosome 2
MLLKLKEKFNLIQKEIDDLNTNKKRIKEQHLAKQRQLDEIKREIEKKNNYLDSLENNKDNKVKKVAKKQQDAMIIIQQHDFIKDMEVDLDTMPDADQLVIKKSNRNALVVENKVLNKKINKKAEVVADEIEEECRKLLERRETVMKDKENLVSTLEECKVLKEKTVMITFDRVNKALDGIFSTLLPGTQAKLKSVNEHSILEEGLELSVAFNGVWKNSLSELSGGQRSLLALSFILAMMKYKPAPIYILDEIDAALDLENTQRIGEMIKKHFKNSQFIIVSLKEQMTFNASVIFRVSNTDGKSKVERINL